MKYLKYFEQLSDNQVTTLDKDDVKNKIDYISQTLIDDYDGETQVVYVEFRDYPKGISIMHRLPGAEIKITKCLDYRLKLDLNSILTDEYKDTIIKISNNFEIELPHSRYIIDSNDEFFMERNYPYTSSNVNKYLSESDITENIFESSVFKPEFLKELKKFNRGIRSEFDKRTIEGECLIHYNVCLDDRTDLAIINVLLF